MSSKRRDLVLVVTVGRGNDRFDNDSLSKLIAETFLVHFSTICLITLEGVGMEAAGDSHIGSTACLKARFLDTLYVVGA